MVRGWNPVSGMNADYLTAAGRLRGAGPYLLIPMAHRASFSREDLLRLRSWPERSHNLLVWSVGEKCVLTRVLLPTPILLSECQGDVLCDRKPARLPEVHA